MKNDNELRSKRTQSMVLQPMHTKLVRHIRMVQDLHYPLLATRVPTLNTKANTDSHRAEWFTPKGMVRWVTTSKAIPIRPTSQATHRDSTRVQSNILSLECCLLGAQWHAEFSACISERRQTCCVGCFHCKKDTQGGSRGNEGGWSDAEMKSSLWGIRLALVMAFYGQSPFPFIDAYANSCTASTSGGDEVRIRQRSSGHAQVLELWD
jgi:hypothetical protein